MQGDRRGIRVEVRDIHKHFGDREVLHGIDLEVEPGELIAVIGKSGCGKSTLLRLVAGLDTSTSGSICVDGEPVRGLSPATRVMFQEARLLPWKRVQDNVALGLTKAGRERAERALEQVGLRDRAREWPATLSGGQKQRVALARALASEPRLLLLDEPLGALDALTRLEMQQLIETLWLERQFTALLVTHDVDEAVTLADRVVLIEAGMVVLDCAISLPRPRGRGSLEFNSLKEKILNRIMGREETYVPLEDAYTLV